MKKFTFLFILLSILALGINAQNVAINDDGAAPDASAMLDVQSTSKGFLPPRIALTSSTDVTTISSPVAGLLIYNTSNTEDVTSGYYYHNGSSWVKVDAGLWSFDLEDDISTDYNVGIGTTSPVYKFDLQGAVAGNWLARITNTSGTNPQGLLVESSNSSNYATFAVKTGSTYNFVVNGDGNVGIGTTSPTAKLEIQASGSGSTGGIRLINHQTSTDISYWSEGQFAMMLGGVYKNVISSGGDSYFNGGDVGIGTSSPSYTLHVNGSVAGVGAYVNASDARLKKDVVGFENGIEKVMALRPVTFNWKREEYPDINLDNRNHVGFIAQEVEVIVPQVVSTADDEMQTKSIAYSDLVPVLTKAIQEQQTEIEALKKELDEIKKMLQTKK